MKCPNVCLMKRAALSAVAVLASAAALVACSGSGPSSSSISSVATATLPVATRDATAAVPAPDSGQPTAPEEAVVQDVPTQAEVITEAVSPEQRCEHDFITAAIEAPELDNLNYCDGQWALLTKMHTDWAAQVFWDGTTWVVPEFDGHTASGLSRGCYLPETFEETGQPPQELEIVYCDDTAVLYG